jgi:hypothetical protein
LAVQAKFYVLLESERFAMARALGVVDKSVACTIAVPLEYHPNKSLNSYRKESLRMMRRPTHVATAKHCDLSDK